MNTYFKAIKKSTLKYVNSDGEYMKVNVQAIKGVNIPNSFNIPYVRGTVGLFNAIISRMMYFTEYDSHNNKRLYPKAQEKIYFPAWQISPMINRCESQSYNIIRSLERILDISVSRAHEKHGANVFRLSQRTHDFLHIFTSEKLNEFIEKYQIFSEDQYALKQLYNYRVVRPTDANLSTTERQEFHTFIKSRRHRNFLHFCSQNNVTPQARIVEIELHANLLSEKQREQLTRIKKYLTEGISKLTNYLHWKLVDLQQFITLMLKKDKITSSDSNQEEDTTNSQITDRNKTEREMQKTHEVAATHLKDPEEPSLQDIVQIATYWNIMARNRNMEFMNSITDKKIQSIVMLVKIHGKEKIIDTIQNTGKLLLNNTLVFNDFIKNSNDPDSRFNKIYRRTNFDTRITEAEEMQIRNQSYKFILNHHNVSRDKIDRLVFNSKAEAKFWFKSNTNNM